MGISFQELYKINGVIDTARPVMQNIEMLTSSCASWLAYDVSTGKWSLVLNKAGNSSFAFDDSNIIGNIDVSGTGMDGLYNSVEIEYPNNDLFDSSDFVRLDLSAGQRKTNEPDLTLSLNYPLINDPIMASALGSLELNQSRLIDTTITFSADYTATTVKGGDIVSVTNTAYDYTNKLFRVLKTEQVNSTNDGITIKITAMEYDPAVYTNALIRDTRSPVTNVRSIGAIGTLSKPVATRIGGGVGSLGTYETRDDPIPRIKIDSTVSSPAGLVEGIELWYYQIPDTELKTVAEGGDGSFTEWQSIDDDTRNYKLLTVLKPGNKSVWESGDAVSHEIANLTNDSPPGSFVVLHEGNYLFKMRAINSVTAGAFSPISDRVNWRPKQKTLKVDNDTDLQHHDLLTLNSWITCMYDHDLVPKNNLKVLNFTTDHILTVTNDSPNCGEATFLHLPNDFTQAGEVL
jgi:hypothetical protein